MKFLLSIPLAVSLGTWVWGEDETPDVTPDVCLESFPVMSMNCWSGLIVKALGAGIILGSCLNKVPIMKNLMESRSTEGLSRVSTYLDAITYGNGAFYGFLQDHPFTAYGENVALVIQTIFITFMLWHLSAGSVNGMEQFGVLLGGAVYAGLVMFVLPEEKQYLLPAAVWPVYVYSRASQILETSRVKHTGAQSILTISMNMFGSLIRILTTIKLVGMDFAVLTSYMLGATLNFVMFAQYFYYQSNTEQFVKKLRAKKES